MLTPAKFLRPKRLTRGGALRATILAAAFLLSSCAALQPPSATGPAGNLAPYPILYAEDARRKEATSVALTRLSQQAGEIQGAAQLQPITGTILNFAPNANRSLYLPKLGATAAMTEEETRESLRRFIREWQELIGADPAKLSLVARVDQPDGSKLASYEQRPFRYPIRGNFGRLKIHFMPDRRVVDLSSTCIPDADRMQTALAALTVRVKTEDAIQHLRDSMIYSDRAGNQLNFNIPATATVTPLGLVIYILPAKDGVEALEFHLAWELALSNTPVRLAYVDAISGDLVATD
jgi:hypothetical protein